MKIVSWNVNGLRSAESYFLKFVRSESPEIILLQEIKARPEQLSPRLRNLQDYHVFFNSAGRKGYAGTAVYTKEKPQKVEDKIGLEKFDGEGRFLKVRFSNFILLNVYMPHGGRKKENMSYKLAAYSHLVRTLRSARNQDKIILAGDFNIAHKEIDLARPEQNQKNTMFTPEERSKMDDLVNLGFEDSFRLFNLEGGHYSWFPYGFGARERNLGWRIDYSFVSKNLKSKVRNSSILKEFGGSDHCPVLVEIEI